MNVRYLFFRTYPSCVQLVSIWYALRYSLEILSVFCFSSLLEIGLRKTKLNTFCCDNMGVDFLYDKSITM